MYQYIITFRLEASASYQERYNDLMRNFEKCFSNTFIDNTTSTLFANSWKHDIDCAINDFISSLKLNKSDEILISCLHDKKIKKVIRFTNGEILNDIKIDNIFEINN